MAHNPMQLPYSVQKDCTCLLWGGCQKLLGQLNLVTTLSIPKVYTCILSFEQPRSEDWKRKSVGDAVELVM